MNLQKIYTALLTADLAAAEGWYTELFGRGPDNRPMDTLVQWELFDHGGLALSNDDEIAGRGVILTGTCSRWRPRPRGHCRLHDRAVDASCSELITSAVRLDSIVIFS